MSMALFCRRLSPDARNIPPKTGPEWLICTPILGSAPQAIARIFAVFPRVFSASAGLSDSVFP